MTFGFILIMSRKTTGTLHTWFTILKNSKRQKIRRRMGTWMERMITYSYHQ